MPDPDKKKHVPQSGVNKPPVAPAHNPNARTTHSEEHRSDTLASEMTASPEEVAVSGEVENMNVSPVDDLGKTDEVSGTPGESISHDTPKPAAPKPSKSTKKHA